MSSVLYYITLLIIGFIVYSSYTLSRKDYRKKNVCPKILGIPACYIVFLFFIGAFLSHLVFPSIPIWYYGFIAVPFLIALLGTVTELSGKVICPRTPAGTPMCYLSLGFCAALIVLKTLTLKL